MTIRMKFLMVLGAILIACLGGFLFARALTRPELVEVPLPPKIVRVQEVREIATPGPERVVERVKLQTKTVEVPVEVVREVIRQAESGGPPPQARVLVEADQFAGVENGKTVRGWTGWATCEILLGESWETLARAPLDLNESEAVSVGGFEPPRPPLNRLDMGAVLTADGVGYTAGYYRRLSWRTKVGRAVLPDWIGADLLALPGTGAVAVKVSWEF